MQKFKAAVIGLGGISPMHIKPLAKIGVQITHVCDKDEAKAKTVAESIGCAYSTSHTEMLKAGGFDAVHICLPHFLHAPVAIDALNAGCHVLTEKPMATTTEDAQKMIDAAKKTGRFLGVIFQNRYNPGTILIKDAVTSGKLGEITGGWLRVTWSRPDEYYTESDWRGNWATAGGGVLINQSIHTFDLMSYMLGEPTTVKATIANRAHAVAEVEDVAEGVIMYGEVPVSFYVNLFNPYDAPAGLEIVGTLGTASIVGDDAVIRYKDGTKEEAIADNVAQELYGQKSYWGVSHIKQITEFYDAINAGRKPETDGLEGLRTQWLINGIYESAKSSREVMLTE